MVEVTIGDEEKERLLKVIFEGLLEKTPMGKVKWEMAFSHNPIGRAFSKEMNRQLNITMQELLGGDEFHDKMAEVGRAFIKKFFDREISTIVNQMMKDYSDYKI